MYLLWTSLSLFTFHLTEWWFTMLNYKKRSVIIFVFPFFIKKTLFCFWTWLFPGKAIKSLPLLLKCYHLVIPETMVQLRETGALKLNKQGLYSYRTWQSAVAGPISGLEVSCSHLHLIWLWAVVGLDRQLSWRICFQCSLWVCKSNLHIRTHCKQKWILSSTCRLWV